MKTMALMLLLLSNFSQATTMIPDDYEDNKVFFKVEKENVQNRTRYKFFQCIGDQSDYSCDSIFDEYGYSKSELNSIETSESVKGSLLLGAEIVTGGIIWKRLMKFTLGGAIKLTQRATGWREGVANGTVALGVTAPTNVGVTVYALGKANDVLEVIDPISRFKRSELIDTDEYEEAGEGIIPLGYDYQDAYIALDEMLSTVK